ncbi:hypothetical protein [Deinococcus sp.]|uniref:hypothetical protein n=1 Tax=Deinococcus sp. TaxID=47478 RepID=UPI003CC596CD
MKNCVTLWVCTAFCFSTGALAQGEFTRQPMTSDIRAFINQQAASQGHIQCGHNYIYDLGVDPNPSDAKFRKLYDKFVKDALNSDKKAKVNSAYKKDVFWVTIRLAGDSGFLTGIKKTSSFYLYSCSK